MHFHLVNVRVRSRQAIDTTGYVGGGGTPRYTAAAIAPDPNELGRKQTVRCPPGYVTQLILHFTLPKVPFAVPARLRSGGNEYVWHCRILEHEEHEMMRPLIVTP